MVVETGLIIEGNKDGQSNASVLQQLVVLLLEKTQNLELIQSTYERDMDVMRERLHEQEERIRVLSAQVDDLSVKVGVQPVKTDESLPAPSVTEVAGSCSHTSDEPISPGLSSSLQDVFNQLEFLNDKSIKLESISSFSDEKLSSSVHSLHLNEDDLSREEEEALTKPTPILVTTLSYDTSTYNDSTNLSDSNEDDIDIVYAEEEQVTKLESTPPMISLSDEEESPPTMKSMKKKAIVTQTLVTKIPIVLQETSTDHEDCCSDEHLEEKEEEEIVEQSEDDCQIVDKEIEIEIEFSKEEEEEYQDVFEEEIHPKSSDNPEDADFRLQYPWTRSDTFDVIPVSQSSQIAVPVKPKRGIVSPLQSQRHPTERDDTIGDIVQSEKTPLQRLPAENTEQFSDHSTFSQVSSNRSSSFDYEVQYIMPQLTENDTSLQTEVESSEAAATNDESTPCEEEKVSNTELGEGGGRSFQFERAEVTVTVSEASNSGDEDDMTTPS